MCNIKWEGQINVQAASSAAGYRVQALTTDSFLLVPLHQIGDVKEFALRCSSLYIEQDN